MNKPEKKNHITISIDEVKVFDTVKYSFMTLKKKKPLSKLEIEGNFLDLVKNICKKLYLILYINDKKLEAFPPRSGTREGRSFSPLIFNIILEALTCRKTRKGNKGYTDWEGRNKTLFVRI